jgi:hypothetical protein
MKMTSEMKEASLRAQAAWKRLKESAHQTWEDYRQIGIAYREARNAIMRELNLNKPNGRYRAEIKAWKAEYELDDLGDDVFNRLLDLVDNLPGVEAWRNSLTLREKMEWNHPNTIHRHWKKATQVPSKKADGAQRQTSRESERERLVAAEEELARVKRNGGELVDFSKDTARDIALVMHQQMTESKLRGVLKELLLLMELTDDQVKEDREAAKTAARAIRKRSSTDPLKRTE